LYEICRYFVNGMLASKKILSFLFVLSGLTFASLWVSGKSKIKTAANHKHNITVGFKTGQESLFTSQRLLPNKHSKIQYSASKSFLIKKQINPHLKLESGLNYNTVQQPASLQHEDIFNARPYRISVPVTLQYYLLPKKSRLQPYAGAGFQYNIMYQNYNHATISDYRAPNNQQPGNKYISIVFTQGMTFEVNTKIEITQSFHFIPNGTEKIIGIDLGIGYKLP